MNFTRLLFAGLLVTLLSSCVTQGRSDVAQNVTEEGLICRDEAVPGSIVRKRVCTTRDERAQRSRQAEHAETDAIR
jgi:hypothetical protein